MPKTAPLWDSGARKEAFDLLTHLWAGGDDKIRRQLAEALTAGPPEHIGPHGDQIEREVSRDRRIFDRIELLGRIKEVPLPEMLIAAREKIQQQHPQWRLPEGDQARFGVWTETKWGPDSRYTVEDLRAISDADELVRLLASEQDQRKGLLDNWRRLATSEPRRALRVLEQTALMQGGGPTDVWQATLWGLREGIKGFDLRSKLIELLSIAPHELFQNYEFSRAVAALLEAVSSAEKEKPEEPFWRLYDLTLNAAHADPQNRVQPDRDDWVDAAINSSLGTLATAFFNALFDYRLTVGQGLPAEQIERLHRLIGLGEREHRFARVIAASRLPYFFAVDPAWARRNLIALLDWADEDEAVAAWQGFAWHPSVAPNLWAEIRHSFLASFSPNRLARLRQCHQTIAQLLMLAGIEFHREALPAEQVRSAIKMMSHEMRDEAIRWLWNYLAQENGESDVLQGERADTLWRDRIQPWLKRVWPHEQDLRTPSLAKHFALLAIRTSSAFPDAVAFLSPFLVKAGGNIVVHELNASRHPDDHRKPTLQLLQAVLDPNGVWLTAELKSVLDRIRTAEPPLSDDPVFRMFEDNLRLRQF